MTGEGIYETLKSIALILYWIAILASAILFIIGFSHPLDPIELKIGLLGLIVLASIVKKDL